MAGRHAHHAASPGPRLAHPAHPKAPGVRKARGHAGKHATSHTAPTPVYRSQATLQAFDATSYLATIQLLKSPDQTIAGVPVSRAIPSANLTVGSTLAVIFFDHHNSNDAMVVGVH